MYLKLKHFIFTLLYLLLWAEFLFMIGDPTASGGAMIPGKTLPFYTAWRGLIDNVYLAADWVCYPVTLIYNALYSIWPGLHNNAFPYMASSLPAEGLAKWMSDNAQIPWPKPIVGFVTETRFNELLPGIFYWIPVVMMLVLKVMNPVLDYVADFFKNVVWNVLIEFSFTKRKQAAYQDALEKRAEALVKLNNEYRSLSKEASQLKTSVITDELTQVYNKRFFIQKITETFAMTKAAQGKMALIMMDIDHFKKLNDTYGHLMGDKVLQQVAKTARQATPGQCYCCRFGGEEFGIIMPGKNYDEAYEVASLVKQNIPLLRFPDQPDLKVTVSQGLLAVDFKSPNMPEMEKFEDLIKLADDELYKAKLEGRDRICVSRFD